jgi:glycine hydroxymethyltransferase
MADFLFQGKLAELDPAVYELTQLEAERQARKLIMIPSESTAPMAVRESLGSAFQNLYAEGYPSEQLHWMAEDEIMDYASQLSQYRRYSDPRYYKGVEYADILEGLAQRRCAELFATDEVPADDLYVNVQPLSGAPANNAVYTALLQPGDTILGMNLLHGGHLSHGSSVNRSGILFNVVHYQVDPKSEKIDYDAVQALAEEHQPKIIIAGYSSYPWIPDWKRFREIADSVGAKLLADISHIAGLIAGKAVPSPVGYAHIITFTTHKTLCGPRGACIITQNAALSRKINRAVFPGEQGGPHVHAISGMATTFKFAQSKQFQDLQTQIIKNCKVLTNRLMERGLRVSFSGTESHMGNVDCKSIKGEDGATLSGDLAARILDIAGIVLNRNTIPGDRSAFAASGIRYGTPWITQRGLDEKDMIEVADIMADVLQACKPYFVESQKGKSLRAKVDFEVLEQAKIRVKNLCDKAGLVEEVGKSSYPHFAYLDDAQKTSEGWSAFDIRGEDTYQFVNYVFTSDVESLKIGESQNTNLIINNQIVEGILTYRDKKVFQISVKEEKAALTAAWLRALSDGYINFDPDLTRRINGPIIIEDSSAAPITQASGEAVCSTKPYYIGCTEKQTETLPEFIWQEKEDELRRTSLFDTHVELGGTMVPFAGWEMPVKYSSIVDEHMATRNAAGLFDATHMGVYQVEGPDASVFLDCVCGNDISSLSLKPNKIGTSLYTHFLDPYGKVIDDLMVYRLSEEKYMVVVNASNDDKDWAWLNVVLEGKVLVDTERPNTRAFGRNVTLRNLRDPKEGKDMRVDIPLQGPKSRDILLALGCDEDTTTRIKALKRTQLCHGIVGGFDLIISRTGYTGEKMAYELFIHPDQAPAFWKKLMETGEPYGLLPCGLGARDSLRTEAGLPLYGHEMSGDMDLGVGDAGFSAYVKTYKPWFIGRSAFIRAEENRDKVIVRFRFDEQKTRKAHYGDPILNERGKVIGKATSCAIDKDGYFTGQAHISIKDAEIGSKIYIYQNAPTTAGKAPSGLNDGDRMVLPAIAEIIIRFPKL